MQFWLHYAPHCDVTDRFEVKDGERSIDYPDFSKRFKTDPPHPGTFFLIDEVHVFFNARRWQSTGTDCTYYLSQHRKLGDDVFFITQHEGQVDKALKMLCQDFTVMTNYEKTRFMGFSIPKTLRRSTYAQLGDREPIEAGFMRLRIAQYGHLYDTNAGIGITGRVDTNEKNGGGKHPIWALVYLALFLAFCWYVPPMITAAIRKMASRAVLRAHDVAQQAVPVTAGATNALHKKEVETNYVHSATNIVQAALTNAPVKPQKLTIERRVIVGAKRTYWLSDGRRIKGDDPNVQFAGEDYIILRPNLVVWFDR